MFRFGNVEGMERTALYFHRRSCSLHGPHDGCVALFFLPGKMMTCCVLSRHDE